MPVGVYYHVNRVTVEGSLRGVLWACVVAHGPVGVGVRDPISCVVFHYELGGVYDPRVGCFEPNTAEGFLIVCMGRSLGDGEGQGGGRRGVTVGCGWGPMTIFSLSLNLMISI